MLIDDPNILKPDGILAFVGMMNGGESKQLATGVYQISHFGSSDFPGRDYIDHYRFDKSYKPLSLSTFGVCDDYQQVIDQCPELQDPNRKFVVTVTEVRSGDQPRDGGWRWHKWGPYIGTHEPQCEYLHDEEGIEKVYCYSIYERK